MDNPECKIANFMIYCPVLAEALHLTERFCFSQGQEKKTKTHAHVQLLDSVSYRGVSIDIVVDPSIRHPPILDR